MIAALSTPPPAAPSPPAPPTGPFPPEPPDLRDIAPPVDVFPWPTWMVVVVAILLLLVMAVLAYLIVRRIRNRPPPIPPSPQFIALRELRKLQSQTARAEPQAFTFAVSDVLRTYVSAAYRVRATEQTSPEFLAAIGQSVKFADAERTLLEDFLGHCDLIKFARIDADSRDNERLLESALRFVEGGRA